jgi:hypothetical protein
LNPFLLVIVATACVASGCGGGQSRSRPKTPAARHSSAVALRVVEKPIPRFVVRPYSYRTHGTWPHLAAAGRRARRVERELFAVLRDEQRRYRK